MTKLKKIWYYFFPNESPSKIIFLIINHPENQEDKIRKLKKFLKKINKKNGFETIENIIYKIRKIFKLTRHHRRPRSRGGTSDLKNLLFIPVKIHNAWHTLFGRLLEKEILEILEKYGLEFFLINENKLLEISDQRTKKFISKEKKRKKIKALKILFKINWPMDKEKATQIVIKKIKKFNWL